MGCGAYTHLLHSRLASRLNIRVAMAKYRYAMLCYANSSAAMLLIARRLCYAMLIARRLCYAMLTARQPCNANNKNRQLGGCAIANSDVAKALREGVTPPMVFSEVILPWTFLSEVNKQTGRPTWRIHGRLCVPTSGCLCVPTRSCWVGLHGCL